MYLPDEEGEYTPEVGTLCFSIQGLTDAITALEFALQLEVTMVVCLGHPHPHVLMECWHGNACAQEQPHTKGPQAHTGGQTGNSLPIFLQQARPMRTRS